MLPQAPADDAPGPGVGHPAPVCDLQVLQQQVGALPLGRAQVSQGVVHQVLAHVPGQRPQQLGGEARAEELQHPVDLVLVVSDDRRGAAGGDQVREGVVPDRVALGRDDFLGERELPVLGGQQLEEGLPALFAIGFGGLFQQGLSSVHDAS